MIIDEIRECIEKMNGEKLTDYAYIIKSKYMTIRVETGSVHAYMGISGMPVKNDEEILTFLESFRNSDLF